MTNLLEETVMEIKGSGHTEEDVVWVGSHDGALSLPWPAFAPIASATEYDSGYGGAEIAGDLVVVFRDGTWLERGEYDGSEWWDFKKAPVFADGRPFKKVDRINYEGTLAGIVEALANPDN